MLLRPARSSDRLVSVSTNFRVRLQRIFQNGMRNGRVVEQRLALGIAPGGQPQFAVFVLHEDIAAFGARELQGRIEQRHQDFIEHADRIQLARSFQKQSQLLQIGGLIRDVHPGNLAEKFAGGVGGAVLRVER